MSWNIIRAEDEHLVCTRAKLKKAERVGEKPYKKPALPPPKYFCNDVTIDDVGGDEDVRTQSAGVRDDSDAFGCMLLAGITAAGAPQLVDDVEAGDIFGDFRQAQ